MRQDLSRAAGEDVDVGAAHYKFVDAAYLGLLHGGRMAGWQQQWMAGCAVLASFQPSKQKLEARHLLHILSQGSFKPSSDYSPQNPCA